MQQQVLQSNANKVAFLQLPVFEPIFSATWVVLILALKINVLREMTFNLTLVSTTTVRIAAYRPYLTNHKLKSLELLLEWWEKCKIAASSSTVMSLRLQLGLRSCKALMKRPMTTVQRLYTSWNCKMWEVIVSDES